MSADAVLDWNAVALQAVANDHTPSIVLRAEQGGPTKTTRALGIVHAAIFDAVNSIDRSYTPYLISTGGPRSASIDAAAGQAAHDTLVALYPSQKLMFDLALNSTLRDIPNGPAELQGILIGKTVAKAILAARANDHSQTPADFVNVNEAGHFQTYPGEPGALSPGWGDVHTFAIPSAAQFLAPPPPAMNTPEYAAAYNEVKSLGGDGITTPTLRTAEQTEIGIFWGYDGVPGLGTPPRLYNQIARTIADTQHNTEVQNARLFALVNIAMADAGIASWDTKYEYDIWRPVRGICQVDLLGAAIDDGNAATSPDPTWKPLGAPFTNGPAGATNFTPPFPAYTSGHATFGAALFETLTRFYGRDDMTFTIGSDEFNGINRDVDQSVRPVVTRTYDSFSEASEENGQSRIYLGIHWAFDKTAGITQGNAIANYVFDNFLKPIIVAPSLRSLMAFARPVVNVPVPPPIAGQAAVALAAPKAAQAVSTNITSNLVVAPAQVKNSTAPATVSAATTQAAATLADPNKVGLPVRRSLKDLVAQQPASLRVTTSLRN